WGGHDRGLWSGASEISCGAKAGPARTGDDDMVVEADVERFGGGGDEPGNPDVLAAWPGIARRMVVGKDQGGRPDLERASDDLARIDGRDVDRALDHGLVEEQAVAAVEIEDAELLDRLV